MGDRGLADEARAAPRNHRIARFLSPADLCFDDSPVAREANPDRFGIARAGPPLSWLFARFIPFYPGVVWIGAPLVLAGTLFAFWARFRLAGNWSSGVVLKQDHELIRSGPYRFVRHPIYTGALLAVAGTACAIGQWRGILGLLLSFTAFGTRANLRNG